MRKIFGGSAYPRRRRIGTQLAARQLAAKFAFVRARKGESS